MPITVDTLGEIKRDQTENSCLLFVNVFLSPSLYMLIQLFSSISVNSGFYSPRFQRIIVKCTIPHVTALSILNFKINSAACSPALSRRDKKLICALRAAKLAFVLYSASSFGDKLAKLSFWSVIQTYTGKTGNKINTTNTTAAQRYQSNPSAL